MSNSVALVAVNRVVAQVRRHIEADPALVERVARKKGIAVTVAAREILVHAAEMALKYTKGDERKAGMALMITHGRVNRLPQCAALLRKFPSKTVRVAYGIKDELRISDASLRALCDLVESTDGDPEGEASRIKMVLEELGVYAQTRKQMHYFHARLREGIGAGRLLETVAMEIIDDVEKRRERGEDREWREDLEREESFE